MENNEERVTDTNSTTIFQLPTSDFQSDSFSLIIPMSQFLKVIRCGNSSAHRRRLATASSSAIISRSNTKFGEALESGPTLDDFLSGNLPERVVLGNTKRRIIQQNKERLAWAQPAYGM